jgi:phenylpropionate dioxygenase-like ring-hydroxylating dioxygenase large terminal subunit
MRLDGFAEEGLADIWTPVALSSEVGTKPVPLRLASERLVLFRGADGRVGALLDRCPHRGVALSLGKVGRDGCLECPFHGWRFKTDGACAEVPLNPLPAEKRRHLGATAFPVRERGGLVWLYTRPGAEPPEEPCVPAALEDPRFTVQWHVEEWRTHWTRAMENMLDAPHLPFVHRRTIGRGMRARLRPDSRMEVESLPTPTGMRVVWRMDGVESADTSGALEWTRPNGMVLPISSVPGRTLRMHLWCVPRDGHTTRMFFASARDFGRHNPLMLLFERFNRVITLEDRRLVETSDPVEVPPASEERSVATDRATLAFRRWYLERRRAARAAVPAGEPLPRDVSGTDRASLAG